MISSAVQSLTIVLIRHAEKPLKGDNLSPEGLHRALQLPAVLHSKFGVPDYLYVPALVMDTSTAHARMFQTATPMAVQYNLSINSKFSEKDVTGVIQDVRAKTGTVLMVWEHHGINELVLALGVNTAPPWPDDDYDSIWIVTLTQNGAPRLTIDQQKLTPSLAA